jgi:predicted RNA polymerase sigma factor
MVALNHAVAVAMVEGPSPGLELVSQLASDERLASDHRLHAVKAHLLEMAGQSEAAQESYERAARLTTSFPLQRYLHRRSARIKGSS